MRDLSLRAATRRTRTLPWRVALVLLAGCSGYGDEFVSDTDRGRIRLAVDPDRTTRIDDVTRFRPVEGGSGHVRVLSRTLPPGVEVVVLPYVRESSANRRDGRPASRDVAAAGPHATWADTLTVESDRPHILLAERIGQPGSPDMHSARLVARQAGEARISFTVQALDESGRPARDPPVEDTMIVEVRP